MLTKVNDIYLAACRYMVWWMLTLALPVCLILLVTQAEAAQLEAGDCVKCHAEVVAEVAARGEEHAAAVGCLDCHLEHPPAGQRVIPECSLCHPADVKPHYAAAGCVGCHDPHAPLTINMFGVKAVTPVCASCHAKQGQQLQDYPSRHSDLGCTACHVEHGEWMTCLDCHEPHKPDMSLASCLQCHPAHQPRTVKYGTQVPDDWCSGCHGDVVATLAANRTKHHDLQCVYCHKYQHKLVPECETCHGQPHGIKMHRKYPDCRECHHGPHALDK